MRIQLSRSKTKQDWVLLVLEGPNSAHPRSLSSLALTVMDHLDGKCLTSSLTLRRLVVNSAPLIKYLRHQNRRAEVNQPYPGNEQNFTDSSGNYLNYLGTHLKLPSSEVSINDTYQDIHLHSPSLLALVNPKFAA